MHFRYHIESVDSKVVKKLEKQLIVSQNAIDKLLEGCGQVEIENMALQKQLAAKDKEIERLKGYAKHLLTCNLMMPDAIRLQEDNPSKICTCGLEALKQKGKE